MASLYLLTLTIALMFAGGQGYSQSMSCSTVNGKMVCQKQSGSGNTAGAFAGSFVGQNGAYQDVGAMTGNTNTGQSRSSRTQLDPLRRFGVPSPNFNAGPPHPNFNAGPPHPNFNAGPLHPNFNAGRMPGSGHLIGTGASDATSFNSNNGNIGISTSGFSGTSNNYGIPGPAFRGYSVADSSGNSFYGGGNAYGGGYPRGYGNPAGFAGSNSNGYAGSNSNGYAGSMSNGYGGSNSNGYAGSNSDGFAVAGAKTGAFNPSDVFASVGLANPFDMLRGRKR